MLGEGNWLAAHLAREYRGLQRHQLVVDEFRRERLQHSVLISQFDRHFMLSSVHLRARGFHYWRPFGALIAQEVVGLFQGKGHG